MYIFKINLINEIVYGLVKASSYAEAAFNLEDVYGPFIDKGIYIREVYIKNRLEEILCTEKVNDNLFEIGVNTFLYIEENFI